MVIVRVAYGRDITPQATSKRSCEIESKAANAGLLQKFKKEGKKRRKAERELEVLRKDMLKMRFALEDAKQRSAANIYCGERCGAEVHARSNGLTCCRTRGYGYAIALHNSVRASSSP